MLEAKEALHVTNCFLFSGMPPSMQKNLLSDPRAYLVDYEKNAPIAPGTPSAPALGLLLQGRVCASHAQAGLALRHFSPGELFGAANLFGETANAPSLFFAKSPARVLFFEHSLLKDFMEKDFRLAENYIRFLQGRIHYLNARIATLGAPNAEGVLLKYLEKEAGDAKQVILDCSMAELAQRLGISRASLYRAVDSLSKKSLLKKSANTFHLLC